MKVKVWIYQTAKRLIISYIILPQNVKTILKSGISD